MRTVRTLVVAAAAASLTAGTMAGATAGPAASPAVTTAVTKAAPTENQKLNRVTTPRLAWFNCYGDAQCATVKLPLDYDQPKGKTTNVAVLRTKATGKRIGTLFVNPGGPGGSATELAYYAEEFLSEEVREKFDVVGIDPRGVGYSDNVQCLPISQQQDTLEGIGTGLPMGYRQEQEFIISIRKLTRGCSKNALATSMSTAQVARDMEMVRRALGDGQLSYLGFSYGSHLGTTYANMFPKNFRSIAIDGTLNPQAWSGTARNRSQPLDFRLKSGKGAWTALTKILDECKAAGGEKCSYAESGDPRKKFDAIAAQLKKKPITITDPYDGSTFEVDYATFVSVLLSSLYSSWAPQDIDWALTDLEELMNPSEDPTGEAARKAALKSPIGKRVYETYREVRESWPTKAFPYDNSLDTFLSVTCTDSQETTKLKDYPTYAKQSDTLAPHFGRLWLWSSAGCAGDAFTGQDEDAYLGPYTRTTTKAVLVVGNYWDPATAYTGAVETRAILGRSRLVSSDSWGHTAYAVSECATQRVDTYLLTGRAPLRDAVCPAESEVFPEIEDEEEFEEGLTVPQQLSKLSLPKASKAQAFPTPKKVR